MRIGLACGRQPKMIKKRFTAMTGLCSVLSDPRSDSIEDTADGKIEGACGFFGKCA